VVAENLRRTRTCSPWRVLETFRRGRLPDIPSASADGAASIRPRRLTFRSRTSPGTPEQAATGASPWAPRVPPWVHLLAPYPVQASLSTSSVLSARVAHFLAAISTRDSAQRVVVKVVLVRFADRTEDLTQWSSGLSDQTLGSFPRVEGHRFGVAPYGMIQVR